MRKQVKVLLSEMERLAPRARESMLGALGNVKASHLLDTALWEKLGLPVARESEEAVRPPRGAVSQESLAPAGARRTGATPRSVPNTACTDYVRWRR